MGKKKKKVEPQIWGSPTASSLEYRKEGKSWNVSQQAKE